MPGNLLSHHLSSLERAGLIERRVSEGDHRRRYVTLNRTILNELLPASRRGPVGSVLFVCSHNSARSQYAAARWQKVTGAAAESAGSNPAINVHPTAVRVAAELGIDLAGLVPRGYESIRTRPTLVVSVCDRAREADVPLADQSVHWSVPDPVRVGRVAAFRSAFAEIDERIDQLAGAL